MENTACKDTFRGQYTSDKIAVVSTACRISAHLYSLTANEKKTTAAKKSSRASPKRTNRTLTRAERAHLESIKSFGGVSLDNVLKDAKRKVARRQDLCKPAAKGKVEEEMEGKGDALSDDDEDTKSDVPLPLGGSPTKGEKENLVAAS